MLMLSAHVHCNEGAYHPTKDLEEDLMLELVGFGLQKYIDGFGLKGNIEYITLSSNGSFSALHGNVF